MRYLGFLLLLVVNAGCTAIPDIVHQPTFHNPFPQLSRVAVLPFYNQSDDPTIDQDQVALAYYNELQAIPGFEVVPVGVSKQMVVASGISPRTPEDFQALARYMDVDAIVVGSVTEFDPYYPPRMGLAVRWYAANPSYHPIPAGYGLPWGTSEEEFIPESLVFEAEFALAKEQLKTQSPPAPDDEARSIARVSQASAEELLAPAAEPEPSSQPSESVPVEGPVGSGLVAPPQLPADWPDPRGFVPAPPSAERPPARPQHEPVLSHTRLYHGNDAEFTKRLANYVYFRDDARFGDWQAYLQRSDDFMRFCCHLHVTEMLAARGGGGKTRVVWRWPIGRYDR
ncbi:MAG: hypothetical protein H6821_12835 [Planctomycetaceae bacterium]|nr:hypothetical protein [Planctomycetaceae bacterium]MCB9939920.1 hypothetical protein [Planctomycetaceae bacterium]